MPNFDTKVNLGASAKKKAAASSPQIRSLWIRPTGEPCVMMLE
jgi:hypothetical protein